MAIISAENRKEQRRVDPMSATPARLMRLSAWVPFCFPINLAAQAAAEYGLKSTGSVISSSTAPAIAGCRVDSNLISCLSNSYPRTSIVLAIAVGILILRWLLVQAGYRTR
jgi:hypothetical protein